MQADFRRSTLTEPFCNLHSELWLTSTIALATSIFSALRCDPTHFHCRHGFHILNNDKWNASSSIVSFPLCHTFSALPTDVVSRDNHAFDRALVEKLYTTLKSPLTTLFFRYQDRQL